MEGSVLSFLKAEWKVSDTGSAHWASSYLSSLAYLVHLQEICLCQMTIKCRISPLHIHINSSCVIWTQYHRIHCSTWVYFPVHSFFFSRKNIYLSFFLAYMVHLQAISYVHIYFIKKKKSEITRWLLLK
jgi:hypothetical protein